jgi:hypothetical protein
MGMVLVNTDGSMCALLTLWVSLQDPCVRVHAWVYAHICVDVCLSLSLSPKKAVRQIGARAHQQTHRASLPCPRCRQQRRYA